MKKSTTSQRPMDLKSQVSFSNSNLTTVCTKKKLQAIAVQPEKFKSPFMKPWIVGMN